MNLSGSAGGQARRVNGINYISLSTNKGRKWTYGYKVDELDFNTDINVSQWLRENQLGARGTRDHRHAMLQQIRGDGGTSGTACGSWEQWHNIILHSLLSFTGVGFYCAGSVSSVKDPKLFKRLDRSMKKTDGKRGIRRKPSMMNNSNDGTKFFQCGTQTTTTVSHFKTARQSRLLFHSLFGQRHTFDKLKRARGRAIPEVIIRYILQFY